jgi:hypothetical protein
MKSRAAKLDLQTQVFKAIIHEMLQANCNCYSVLGYKHSENLTEMKLNPVNHETVQSRMFKGSPSNEAR